MPAAAAGVQANLHRSDEHSWALITRAPDSRLKPYVIDYWGYRERARTPMRRLQPPFAAIPMIVTFGPSIDIINATGRLSEACSAASWPGCTTFTSSPNMKASRWASR